MAPEARILIAPSVLAADFSELGRQVRQASKAGADLIHVDVMDGQFVPNISFGPVVVDAVRRSTTVPLDIHLMIAQADNLLPGFMKAATDQITVHAEACQQLHRTVARIKEQGNRVGVALNPETPVSAVEGVLPFLDTVLVMTVNPGFGGQPFIPETLDKVKRLRQIIIGQGLQTRIEVDGGVKADWTAQESVRAGATVLVSGTGIFNKEETIAAAMRRMRACIRGVTAE